MGRRGTVGRREIEGIRFFPNKCHVVVQILDSKRRVLQGQATGSVYTDCPKIDAPHALHAPGGHAD